MANEFNLEVSKREILNKNNTKQFRNQGKIPGVYYSHDSKNSIPFYIEKTMLRQAYKSGARIFNIKVGDKKRTVIFKSVQYHPVTDQVLHVDLYGVKMDQTVTVNVEVKLTGSAAGVAEGGILVQGLNEVEVECLPLNIPEFIEVDVSNLELGDSIRISDISVDENITIKSADDQILASVTHPMKEEEIVSEITEEDEEFMDEEGVEGSEESKKEGEEEAPDDVKDDKQE